MTTTRDGAHAARLRAAGLRPTRQRLALAKLLLAGPNRHVTAEQLHREAELNGLRVSLATVYNTLHQFTESQLMREVVVEPGRVYFDTNMTPHHHFYNVATGALTDIDADNLEIRGLPAPPAGTAVASVDVIVRVSDEKRN